MDATSPTRAWWNFHPSPPPPRSIVELIRAGTVDPTLAAMLWLLVEARVPLIVAALRSGAGKSTILETLMDFLPPGTRRVDLAGVTETFDWLPHARELGWQATPPPAGATSIQAIQPSATWLVAAELSDHLPIYTWGDAARVVVRAITVGYGLGATIHADSLEEVLDALHRPPVALTDDELSRLGVVLVLRTYAPPPGDVNSGPLRRVVAAHYIRPVFRDGHGHVQRLGPAVLATWDEARDRFEHFAWGVLPELAERTGQRAGDFEADLLRREEYLTGLAAAGVTDVAAVRTAIEGYRAAASTAAGNPN